LLHPTKPYRKRVAENLVLRSIADERDVERVAAFQVTIHGEGVGNMVRELVPHHPNTRPEHWLYVEDESTGEVVSSLCLIPWTWRYEDVELRVGEVGIVATSESYRHRGLVRAQMVRHHELLREGGYDLSQIQGIGYFYRQFGYEYAIPLIGGWRVDLHLIRDAPEDEAPGFTFRLATETDIPDLVRLYDEAATELSVHAVRSEAEWRYLIGPSMRTEMVAGTWLVLGAEGAPVGYVRVFQHGFGEGLIVCEVSRFSPDAARAALRHLKSLCAEQGKPFIQLALPESNTLMQVARWMGAHDLGHYAWQIHLVDVARLLRKLAPVFERRIAASDLTGWTRTFTLSLYREAFELRFEEGKLAAVEALGFRGGAQVRMPPLLLAPLLLGYRSRKELAQAYHDFSAGGEWGHVVDVLFPKVSSYVYTIY